MSRDNLIPRRLATLHPRWQTPTRLTLLTGSGVAFTAAFLPIGKLADIANSGTLFAFTMVAIAVHRLRRMAPSQTRPFRAPVLPLLVVSTLTGCLGLYLSLPHEAQFVLPLWSLFGLCIYMYFKRRGLRAKS